MTAVAAYDNPEARVIGRAFGAGWREAAIAAERPGGSVVIWCTCADSGDDSLASGRLAEAW